MNNFYFAWTAVDGISTFTNPQAMKIGRAVNIIDSVWNDYMFQKRIFNFSWNCICKKWFFFSSRQSGNTFTYTPDSNGLVAIALRATVNPVLKLRIGIGSNGSATAETDSDTKITTIYPWWIDQASDYELANTLAHEYTHTLGYSHPFHDSCERPFSVPYATGDLVEEMGKANGY